MYLRAAKKIQGGDLALQKYGRPTPKLRDSNKKRWCKAFSVGKIAMDHLSNACDEDPNKKKQLEASMLSGPLKMRSNCSGIGAIDEAAAYLKAGCEFAGFNKFKPESVSVCDINPACQKYLKGRLADLGHEQACVFKDVLDFLPKGAKSRVEECVCQTTVCS